MNPNHLFEQALQLASPTGRGAPRQVDLRRAVSAIYYGMFHFTFNRTPLYTLAYRSVDHGALSELCKNIVKHTTPQRYSPYVQSGFNADMKAFAVSIVNLKQLRHKADYSPHARFTVDRVKDLVAESKIAISRFGNAGVAQREAFLTLLVFPPRSD